MIMTFHQHIINVLALPGEPKAAAGQAFGKPFSTGLS